jgi:hypothetical protein
MFKRKKSTKGTKKKLFSEELINAKDIIAPASIKINSSDGEIGEILTKTYFIFSYPRYLNTGWLSPIINLDTPLDISFFFASD